MYPVTPQYEQDMSAPLRPESTIKIVFGVSDPDAPFASTLTDNGSLYYSNVGSCDLGIDVTKMYETLEHNRFTLDAKNPLALKVNPLYQGYVGNEISDANGNFINKPKITMQFSEFFEFAGLSFNFDSVKNNYPASLTVVAYNNTSLILNKTYSPIDPIFVVPDAIPICNKIEITCNSTNIPHRRFRISEILYGIIDVLYDANISDCSFSTNVDLMSNSLPRYDFKFSIFDIDGKYDPEKPDNLFQYLESGQSVKFLIGQTLTDGSIEWIPISNGFTSGEVEVSNAGFTKNISVSSTSVLDFLDMEYDEGIYYSQGRTFYDLANDVVTFAGYRGTMQIDDYLKTLKTSVPLTGHSVKECLQLIANACNCSISINRSGQICILPIVNRMQNFTFGFEKMTNLPLSKRVPALRDINSSFKSISIDVDVSEIAKLEINSPTLKEVSIKYNPAINVTYSLSGLSVVGTPKIFVNKMVISLSGNGTITLNGNFIQMADVLVSKRYREIGSDLNIFNELIDSESFANSYCDNMANYYQRRSTYEFDNRGYPELDLLDDVVCQTNYVGEINSTIIQNDISFNGTIKGKSKVLSLDKN